jgi:hypothetical protein
MITGAFDREGQSAEKKNSGDRMDAGYWILDTGKS